MAQPGVHEQEKTLTEGTLMTIKGGFWIVGKAVLTEKRFLWLTKGYGFFTALGIIGTLINQLFPAKVALDIPLSSITVIGRGKLGLKKDVLYIETVDGKKHQLTPNYDLWVSAVKNVLIEQKATLTQVENERWMVQR